MFFYLDWEEKRPSQIIVTDTKPLKCNFNETFKIKKEEFTICGNINPKFTKYYPPSKLVYRKNQYLSSHLQKAIRRMDDIKSVQTAKHFIDLDYQSFLRRLPIIMMEDVTIHESVKVIVWLMIALTKGFEMKYEIVKWLLGVVYYLANENVKTYYDKSITEDTIWKDKDDDINTLLYCLRFRKCYGGMKGDLSMTEYYIYHINSGNIQCKSDKIPMIKIEMTNLKKDEWIYQANDFHCNRSIVKQVQKYYPKMKEEEIKELIWCFSSSLNSRECIIYDKKLEQKWNEIRKVVRNIQKNCVFY